MIFYHQLFLWFIYFVRLIVAVNIVDPGETGAKGFLQNLNQKSTEIASKLVKAQWEFETNFNDNSKKELFQTTSQTIENAKLRFHNVVENYPWRNFSDPDVRRQLKLYSEIGLLALPSEEYQKFQKIISDLDLVQENTTICDYYNRTKCDLHLNPDIKEKVETSQNEGELFHLWTEWGKATKPELNSLLTDYVKLCNEAAVLNNYTNFQEYSLRNIEEDDIKQEMISLWEDVQPFYKQIHAYVRKKLRDVFGEKIVPQKGSIPSYLLGNIWSENWSGIAQRLTPYPDSDNVNYTSAMISQGYTPTLLRLLAEDFFASMNFSIPSNLWFNESSEASSKRVENCHPKIFNFYNDNVRIKDCEKVSFKDYLTANRLMAKAQYVLQYSHQPYIYQSPADPGLEEALDNVITLSTSTFKNLKKLELFKNEVDEHVRLNRLFKLALEKVTSIPFLLVQEFWRWDVYSGKAAEDTSSILSDLREKFQGISTFTKELTFDPGGIGSAFSKISLVHRFLSYFLEFQIYESLCLISKGSLKENEDLDECNLHGSVDAGNALKNVMSQGSSKSLMETLVPIIGHTKISAKPLLKFFEPLMNWLKKENERTGEFVGWEKSTQFQEKTRRKRSIEDYSAEGKNDDTDNTASKEPNRYQRLVHKRSKDNAEESEYFERKRKSTGNEQREIEKQFLKNKLSLTVNDGKEGESDENVPKSLYLNKRGYSYPISQQSANKNSKDFMAEERKDNENSQKSDRFVTKNQKRYSDSNPSPSDYGNAKPHGKTLNRREENQHDKMNNNGYEVSKNYDNTGMSNNLNINSGGTGNGNNRMRYTRRAKKQQKRRFSANQEAEQIHETWRRQDQNQYQRNRPSRNAQWQADLNKDLSGYIFLHPVGMMENKGKVRDYERKYKGDLDPDMRSSLSSKDSSYENMFDYSRIKSGDTRGDSGDEKGTNKFWPVKSYLTDSGKMMQSSQSLDKKDSVSTSHLTGSYLQGHSQEEKSVGKKETSPSLAPSKDRNSENTDSHMMQTSNDQAFRQFNLDVPSLQALFKSPDLSSYGQRPFFTMSSDTTENKARNDLSQLLGISLKSTPSKYNSYAYKYSPSSDMLQFKEKKEYREDTETGSRSPYIIILGQVTPDMKDRLMQDKGITYMDTDSGPFQMQSGAALDEKKMSDKRSRASEQIYVVPIDMKNSQHNSLNSNSYAENENGARHDPNTERDHVSEEDQLSLEGDSKVGGGKYNYYSAGKENPSEYILSWNNDKNRKIVKRSKRDHGKEVPDEKLKLVRLSPMKESVLENLLGKSLDHANLDDKNVKILIHDALLNGGTDVSSALTSDSSMGSPSASIGIPVMDQSQPTNLNSPMASLASSVLSALSPRGYMQAAKATGHQDSDLEEDSLKENSGNQAVGKDQKEAEMPYLMNPGLRCNGLIGKKKGAKLYSDDEKKLIDSDPAAKGDDACCKKIILSPCPPKCPNPCPCPCPCPLPCPCPCPLPCPGPLPCSCPLPCPCPPPCPSPCPCPLPCPCPEPDCCKKIECPTVCCKPECPDLCCKRPSECSLVNCQFKITKAKKPHERLTIMIYDRINPPAELPEPYDALAVISEILQRIQCCSCKPSCQLTEEDPDYPANDNSDQLKGNNNQGQESNKAKIQELSGEIPILGNDNPEEDETDDSPQNPQNSQNAADEDKYQPKEKATPALDQLTVFNKDKLKPVFIGLRKIDDIIKKRSQQE